MSLDIDADVLVTEIAPVPALIQRMGRCCRVPIPQNGRLGEVHVYRPNDEKPYEKREIKEGREFVEAMCAHKEVVSHADLSSYLTAMQTTDPFIEEGYAGFLDAGPYAMAHDESFREGSDYTVDCVLDSEIDDFLVKRRAGEPEADGYIVPVPRRFTQENGKLGRYLRAAREAHYHPDFGFLDEEKSTWLKK
jgi:CRISPR-associated endonuclease/helicase Cas3